MKKASLVILPCMALIVQVTASAVDVNVNDTRIVFDERPRIIEDHTMVPMRPIFEVLGAEVNWIAETETVVAQRGDDILNIKINSDIMQLNNKNIKLDALPAIINERTFVPVRAISEALNCEVEWDAENQAVHITDNSGYVNLDAAKRYGENDVSILFNKPICQWRRDSKTYYADLDFDGINEKIGFNSVVHPAIQPAIEIDFLINGREIGEFMGTQYSGLYAGYIVDLDKNDNAKEVLVMYGTQSGVEGFFMMRYENKNIEDLIIPYKYGNYVYESVDAYFENIDYSDRLTYIECYGDGWLTFTFESGKKANFKEYKRGYYMQIQ